MRMFNVIDAVVPTYSRKKTDEQMKTIMDNNTATLQEIERLLQAGYSIAHRQTVVADEYIVTVFYLILRRVCHDASADE